MFSPLKLARFTIVLKLLFSTVKCMVGYVCQYFYFLFLVTQNDTLTNNLKHKIPLKMQTTFYEYVFFPCCKNILTKYVLNFCEVKANFFFEKKID